MIPVDAKELTVIDGERTVVTSALPYIHGVPHLGNIVGSLLPADMYHRYLELRGHDNIFICGSDEHGTPLELSAIEADEGSKEHADKQHEKVKSVLDRFDMDFSLYGRTHTEYNRKQTQEMFKHLYQNGYIDERTQNMPYSESLDRFLPDRYIEGECPHCGGLARGDQCDDCGRLLEPEELIEPHDTIEGNTDIEFKDTKNLFLDLPAFADDLRDWVENEAPLPKNKQQEVLNLIDDGLEERCITRDIDWGFDIPWQELGLDEVYDDKVLYVWFDAPIGYIGITRQFFAEWLHDSDDARSSADGDTAAGDEDEWRSYWQDPDARTVYSIGKDNTIFHSIIFPSMLMGGAGENEHYNLPDHIFIHEYLLSDDVQFSKSRGTGLSSEDALELLPPDYWRFYLARNIPQNHDTKFSWSDFEKKVNGELNDTVGNFVNRVLSLTEKWFDNQAPTPNNLEQYEDTINRLLTLVQEYDAAFEEEKSQKKALEKALEIARLGDEFISQEEPWNHEDVREDVILVCLKIVDTLSAVLYPFTPEAARKIHAMLWESEAVTGNGVDVLADRHARAVFPAENELGEREILFEKIDADYLRQQVESAEDTDEDNDTGESDMISIEDFQALDLRTGTVKSVEEHPNADKLYLVQVDVGGETKQSCAGLRDYYTPEELEGRQVVVVNNLEPAELRGETSECMMLAVDDEENDNVVLLQPSEDVEDGLTVR